MGWFNYYGLAILAVIMIPNIIFAVQNKEGFKNSYRNKAVEIAEQIGRYGCFALTVINIPYTYFNFWFDGALIAYLSVNGALLIAYLAFWIIYRKKDGVAKALALSIIPTCIFIFDGIVLAYIPLIAFSIIFGVSHILLSYKNAVAAKETEE